MDEREPADAIYQTLIWSGACGYDNRHVFDMKPINMDGRQHLKFHLSPYREDDSLPANDRRASGVVMDNSYQEVNRIVLQSNKTLDRHEFRPQPDGKKALITTSWKTDKVASELDQGQRSFLNTGFQEIDMSTGRPIFDWDPWSHGVLVNESCDLKSMQKSSGDWDWAHFNSVDKNFGGDYLVSSRHTSTIYKISGVDGSVIWRLGGCAGISDFEMDDGVPFMWQHHARWRFENETHTVISLFDNASEDEDRNQDIEQGRSCGKIIMLDHVQHTARMLRRFDRPDGESSNDLGSLQTLDQDVLTSRVLVNWGLQGYISEYDDQDRLVLEAKFLSDRHRTYRAYKYPWVGHPLEPPVLKVLPIAHSTNDVASAFYVSWNGATEVDSWAFYGGNILDEPFKLLSTVRKHGFETSWVMAGAVRFAYAQGLDAKGQILGKSTTASIVPVGKGDFKLKPSILNNVVTFDEFPIAPKTGSLSICKQTGSGASIPSSLFSFVVGVLALFGLFGVARRALDEVLRRQKGYKKVPTIFP